MGAPITSAWDPNKTRNMAALDRRRVTQRTFTLYQKPFPAQTQIVADNNIGTDEPSRIVR